MSTNMSRPSVFEKNAELYQNIYQTLTAIQNSNTNLIRSQHQSYEFHKQHSKNIKKIISSLGSIHDHCSSAGFFKADEEYENINIHDLTYTPQNQNQNLHELITSCKNDSEEMERVLLGLTNISTLKELEKESLELVLPFVEKFLNSNGDNDKRGYGLGYLLELVDRKIIESVLNKKEIFGLKGCFEGMVKGIKQIGHEITSFDVSEEELRNLYNFLKDCVQISIENINAQEKKD